MDTEMSSMQEGSEQMMPRKTPRRTGVGVLLLLILLGGAAFRLWAVQDVPIWYDEVLSYETAQDSFGDLLRWRIQDPVHPPLHYILMRAVMRVVGNDDPLTLRLVSLMAGVLVILACFLAGRAIRGSRLGLIFAAMAAFDPTMLDQSCQARHYTLFALFFILVLAALVRILQRGGGIWSWVGFGLLCALLFWSHAMAFVIGAATVVTVALTAPRPRGRAWSGLGVASMVALGFCHIGLVRFFARRLEAPRVSQDVGLSQILSEIWLEVMLLFEPRFVSILIVAGGLIGLLLLWRWSRSACVFAWATIAFLFAFLIVLRGGEHYFVARRYFISLELMVCLGWSVLIVQLMASRARWLGWLLLAGLLGYFAVFGVRDLDNEARALGAQVEAARAEVEPGDALVFYPEFFAKLGTHFELKGDFDAGRQLHGALDSKRNPEAPDSWPHARTWVFMGHLNPSRHDRALAILSELAARHGARVEEKRWREWLRTNLLLTVRVGEGGLERVR